MTIDDLIKANAARQALFDVVEYDENGVPSGIDAALSALYDRERSAVISISETPVHTLEEIAVYAAVLARLCEEDRYDEEQPLLARRIADDLARLAGQTCARHS